MIRNSENRVVVVNLSAKNVHWLFLLIVPAMLLSVSGAAVAREVLFEADQVMDISLEGPLGSVLGDIERRDYRTFSLTTGGVTVSLKVRVRGHSRVRVCDFPPLKLNFPQGENAGTAFDGQDKLKLVTHCRNYDRGEQDLLEEYVAYRIFNLLTDSSYRVQLVRIQYVDTDGEIPDEASPRYGFIIESLESLATRLNARPAELKGLPVSGYDRHQAALVFLFQYLIANTDFQLLRAEREEYCCHNVDLLEKDSEIIMVPYDFDLSGLVNARYAYPDPMLRIKRVRQRLYRGLCTEPAMLEAALKEIKERKESVLSSVTQTPGLSEENIETAREFLAKFFDMADDEPDLLRSLAKHCVESY
jgi:hypothetical protein